ncbi:MAG: CBS domain-containing protein [Syntrophobacteraceae bacterium]
MIKAQDIMIKEVLTVTPETSIQDAVRLLLDRRINGLPVINRKNKLVGILCQSDLIAQQKRVPLPSVFTLLDSFIPLASMKSLDKEIQKMAAFVVSDAMTTNPVTVRPETEIEEIATLMVEKKYHTLPVVGEDGELVGVIGKEDILKTLLSNPPEK